MQTIENQAIKGQTIFMDGKRFIKCKLTDCKLIYGGGDCTWIESQFINCELAFEAAAQRTIGYLQGFNLIKAPEATQHPPTALPTSGTVH